MNRYSRSIFLQAFGDTADEITQLTFYNAGAIYIILIIFTNQFYTPKSCFRAPHFV